MAASSSASAAMPATPTMSMFLQTLQGQREQADGRQQLRLCGDARHAHDVHVPASRAGSATRSRRASSSKPGHSILGGLSTQSAENRHLSRACPVQARENQTLHVSCSQLERFAMAGASWQCRVAVPGHGCRAPLVVLAPPPARGALVPPALPDGEPLQRRRCPPCLCRPRGTPISAHSQRAAPKQSRKKKSSACASGTV